MITKLAALLFLFTLVGLGWIWLRWFERSRLYYPEKEILMLPSHVRLPYEDVAFQTPDGTRLHGWFINGKPGATTLLFCHGNGGNISDRVEKLRRLAGLGVNVFIFDYAGYGRSEGRPSEKATYRDTLAAYAYLVETRGTAPDDIVLYGESLGCAMAVELASRAKVRALILESPFTSTVAMGERLLPWLPVRAIVRYRYDSLSKIPGVRVPLLVMHSRTDEIVPFDMGREIYEAAGDPKTFLELPAGHNDGYEAAGTAYTDAIGRFLNKMQKT